jgi:formate dehydrogenase (NADP+) beta subunit
MVTAVVLMGSLGLVVGIGLAIASKIFYVYVDPTILAVDEVLPGANCGGCGFPGCSSNAEAIVAGKSAPNSCVAAGPEIAQAIAAILGVSVEAKEPDIALPGCTYGVADADTKYEYSGMNDCRAVALLSGGMKVCTIGCLGLGTCARVCPFNAITMGPKGLPVVDEARCTGCGTCERACPKHIITLSSITRRILKEYTTEDCTTPCRRACPAGINISGYVGAVAAGDHKKAVRIIKERNPFPAVIGRICPRPCENECRRQYVDEPVAINYLKRFAADFERAQQDRILPYKAPDSGRRVAVVGGGVEGLSTAFFAARLGHAVTVYEANAQAGGLLRTAIARYRLPMEILDWDIDGILAMGVDIQTGVTLDRQRTVIDLLADNNQAVFLAVGGWDSRLARTKGRGEASPAPGCHLLIDIVKAGRPGYADVDLNGSVVIVGSPQLTPEMIDRCKQLGARKITLLIRDVDASMPLLADVDVRAFTRLNRLYGTGDNLTGVDLFNLENGTVERIEANHVVFASGRIPELIFAAADTEAQSAETAAPQKADLAWEAFAPYKQAAYHDEVGLLARGDVLTDFSAAIRAIAAGRRAAASLHKSIYRLDLELPDNVVTPTTMIQNVTAVSHVPSKARQLMPLATASQVARNEELEKGFSPQTAKDEADRCLRCGLICYLRQAPSEPESSVATA